jgi:Siphovirus-type tail component, C-terminal domain
MPLLLPPPVVTPPPPPPAPTGVAVTTIIDPSGREWPLDGTSGLWLQPGRKGFHAPNYVHYRDESPAVDGAFWRGVRATVGDLFIPLAIVGRTRNDLLTTRRQLIAAVSPKRGECTIVTSYPDAERRAINARYDSGMEGEEGKGAYGVTVMRYGLRFIADDPYHYGDPITTNWGSDTTTRTELPIPGADTAYEVVTAAQVLGAATILNTGDVDSYPIWTFTGPFTAITLANNTSGKTLTLTHTAATSADRIVIDTRPGLASIVDEAGANAWAGLTAGYALWPLLPGDNDINIAVSGTTAATTASMTYRPRYEAA